VIPTQITDYIQQGLELFTSEYQNGQAPQLQLLTASYLVQAQVLENAIWDVINLRQLANLRIYSPLAGTFHVIHGNANVTAIQNQSNYIFVGSVLTFSNYATAYTVTGIDSTGTIITLSAPFGGTTSLFVSATQPLTNANMDVVGNLVGQQRLNQNDLNFLSVITLRIAINRSFGAVSNWSDFAGILLKTSSAVSYYESGDASFFFGVWDMTLNPVIIAEVLATAVPNGVGPNIFAYSIWPDGNDFEWADVNNLSTTGQGTFGDSVAGLVGGLLVSGVTM
jgi:hypothetical protein